MESQVLLLLAETVENFGFFILFDLLDLTLH